MSNDDSPRDHLTLVARPQYLFHHRCPDWEFEFIHEFDYRFLFCECPAGDGEEAEEFRLDLRPAFESEMADFQQDLKNNGSLTVQNNLSYKRRRTPADKDRSCAHRPAKIIDLFGEGPSSPDSAQSSECPNSWGVSTEGDDGAA